ncbi:MAG TPA: hypothetical protein VMI75_16870, partial [Polyangiaceae bacterium]|nr:hypothetical protein [Polyangiaceae bacterium]
MSQGIPRGYYTIDPTTGQPIPATWNGTALVPTAQPSAPAASSAPAAAPASTGTASTPYATSTIGYNGNAGLSGTQQPGIFGTGTFLANPYAVNDQAITGAPAAGAASNYGLNDVMGRLQQEVAGLQPQSYQATAPQAQAAQGAGASGTAAQGTAATGTASGYNAALGNASTANAASGLAALGNASLARAAQGGYATTGGTQISTAGDAQFQQQQQQLANTLATQANGGGVSPADLQLQQGMQQQIAGQLAVLGSQRGGS